MSVSALPMVDVSSFASAQTGAAAGTTATTTTAHMDDVSRFQQVFSQAQPTQAAQEVKTAPASQDMSTGIKSILGQFNLLNSNATQLTKMADAMSASNKTMTPSEIIDMTLRCHELVFQAELTSNVANRSSEGIQQLFRQQS